MYFPGNYRWSAGFINMLGSGAVRRLRHWRVAQDRRAAEGKAAEDDEAWFDACVKVADGVRAHAEKFDKGRHRFSAAHAYLRACNYYQMAERFRTPKDKKALDAFTAQGVDCFHRHAALTDVKIEVVEVPFEGRQPARLFRACAEHQVAARKPCVVFFDGLDVTKEIQYMRGVPDLIKRGISVLVMDGPGTGEAIRFRGHYLRHDYEVAGSACIDCLEKRADVDREKESASSRSAWAAITRRAARRWIRAMPHASHGARIGITTRRGRSASTPNSRRRYRCPAITSRGYSASIRSTRR